MGGLFIYTGRPGRQPAHWAAALDSERSGWGGLFRETAQGEGRHAAEGSTGNCARGQTQGLSSSRPSSPSLTHSHMTVSLKDQTTVNHTKDKTEVPPPAER